MSWASPTLRRKVDLPPWLAPVTITRSLSSALTSLPTTRSFMVNARQTSYSPVQENRALAGRDRHGEGGRRADLRERLVQVHAADVEGELGLQHAEEAQNMVGGLGERVGHEVDARSLSSASARPPAWSRGWI